MCIMKVISNNSEWHSFTNTVSGGQFLYYNLAICSWADYSPCLSLSFLICKIEKPHSTHVWQRVLIVHVHPSAPAGVSKGCMTLGHWTTAKAQAHKTMQMYFPLVLESTGEWLGLRSQTSITLTLQLRLKRKHNVVYCNHYDRQRERKTRRVLVKASTGNDHT